MKFQNSISKLLQRQNLDDREAYALFDSLFRGNFSRPESKAVLLLLAVKGESAKELFACWKALRHLEPPRNVRILGLMDTCGTGGDGSHSVNISTLAALVIAAAGGKVAKHGNRAISSKCGSSDLMEAMGINLNAKPDRMIRSIRNCGAGYFHAPFYHPVFSRIQPLRRELKARTILNLLGPLVNPLKLQAQIVGVSKRPHLSLFAEFFRSAGLRRVLVCHSRDGMDEISAAAPTDVAIVERGRVHYLTIVPQKFGFKRRDGNNIKGGNAAKNKKIALRLLQGKLKGPVRDTVILNSGAGLFASGMAKNLHDGIKRAEMILDSGRAYRTLKEFQKLTSR